jgi:hypothetical protein
MSEEAKACFFVLPLQEAVAHFARRNTRSTETEMGSSDNGDAHTSIAMSANFEVGFLPLRAVRARRIVSSRFWLPLCRGDHP